MYNLRALDSRVRTWLRHAPLSAIVVLLKAINDELGVRGGASHPSVKSPARVQHVQHDGIVGRRCVSVDGLRASGRSAT
jgi:hypothetical protein